jgi:hypothetical protein
MIVRSRTRARPPAWWRKYQSGSACRRSGPVLPTASYFCTQAVCIVARSPALNGTLAAVVQAHPLPVLLLLPCLVPFDVVWLQHPLGSRCATARTPVRASPAATGDKTGGSFVVSRQALCVQVAPLACRVAHQHRRRSYSRVVLAGCGRHVELLQPADIMPCIPRAAVEFWPLATCKPQLGSASGSGCAAAAAHLRLLALCLLRTLFLASQQVSSCKRPPLDKVRVARLQTHSPSAHPSAPWSPARRCL